MVVIRGTMNNKVKEKKREKKKKRRKREIKKDKGPIIYQVYTILFSNSNNKIYAVLNYIM